MTASPILHTSIFPAMGLPPLPSRVVPSLNSSERQVSIRARRYLASTGLLLALSIEVCGCNPAQDLGPPFHTLAESHASIVLAPSEQVMSFYDPVEPVTNTTWSLLKFTDPPTDAPSIPIEAKPLPWAIPESVYLVYKGRAAGEQPASSRPHQSPVATAFVLSVPDRNHIRYARFLVTARHVVDPQWAHCSERNPASIDVRLNRRTGGVAYETVPLQSGAVRHFYTSSDPTADLAVIPIDQGLISHLNDYKFIDVPFRLLPTSSEMHLFRADQQIMTAGLSTRPAGESGNYPVFDSGFLSKMPAEAIGVRCGVTLDPQTQAKLLHVWFINASVPQGVSGAPVYTSIARGPGTAKTPVLLGIQSVAWPDSGIAGITPSTALGDLVQSALSASKLHLDFYRGPNP